MVSYDIDLARNLCQRVLLLDGGHLVKENASEKVIGHYPEIAPSGQ